MKQKQGAKGRTASNELHGRFDDMVDAVLGVPEKVKKTLVKDKAVVETWSVPLQDIYDNPNMRLDATHYDRQTAAALDELNKSNFPLKPLSELAAVNLPGQFVRIWAKDEAHGIPYVNATDMMSLTGIGTLAGEPGFLSHESEVDIDELTIHKGWLLLTCSGTIGRVFYVPERIDGWVATHDLIRIIPHDDIPVGFLYAYLSSPMAQKQIAGHTHGGQIDHVTHHQVGGILVPVFPKDRMAEIHKQAMKALNQREEAIATLAKASDDIQQSIKANSRAKNVKR
jgi:hypothetical protein